MEYELKKTAKARRLRIVVNADGVVVVHAPLYMSAFAINSFVFAKREWINAAVDRIHKYRISKKSIELPRGSYVKHKEEARGFVERKLRKWNAFYQFKYTTVSIRNQKSRWGSCSAKGSLSFNYKLLFIPEHLADYVVVHELAHLAHLNHSVAFWNTVAQTIPDHKKVRHELRSIIFSTPKKRSSAVGAHS